MLGRVLARLVAGCLAAAGVLALALVPPGDQPAPIAVARSGGPAHVDPLPPGTRMSDPVDTASLYQRAGLTRVAARSYREAAYTRAATVPPGSPSTLGLDEHVRPSCSGTGTDGRRVQVLYVREAGTPSRYQDVLPVIRNEVANVDDVFAVSSRETGGDLRVRWVHDDCVPVVEEVVVSDGTLDYGLDRLIEELWVRGYDDPERKYLAFAEARRLCGVGTYWLDDSTERNANDGYGAAYSRVDTPCWTGSTSTAAHELMHNLGGIQMSAPNSTRFGHCTDEADLMCYDDGSGSTLTSVCEPSHDQLFDCRGDDYFNTAPTAGGYLATHWNTARSGFLDPGGPGEVGTSSEPARVRTAARARIDWRPRRHKVVGRLVDASGRAMAGERLVLQERRPGTRWRKVAVRTTDEAGRVRVGQRVHRTTYFRWVFRGSEELLADRSPRMRVRR